MSTSSWAAIVARIVAQIQTVPNVGLVYDRLRLVVREEDLSAVSTPIGGESRLRVWMVRLQTMDTAFADAGGSMEWNRRALIEGFLQIEDANDTEATATALAESIVRILGADVRATRLNGTVLAGRPPVIVANEPRVFGFVLCHYARLEMPLTTLEL